MKIASTTYYSASSKLLLSKSLHDYTFIYEMDVDFGNIIGPYLLARLHIAQTGLYKWG